MNNYTSQCKLILRTNTFMNKYLGCVDVFDVFNIHRFNIFNIHRSMSTQTYLEKQKICYISDWPPQSPDLNIIENMWAILKRNVSKRFPSTLDELWKVATEEWYKIDDAYIKNLYSSIPKRLDAVIKMKGYHTKY